MNTPPGDLHPQRVLTPKRRRSFLSFRRKSDLAWFITSLVMFSSGMTAFVFVVFSLARGREPSPVIVAAPPLPAPLVVSPPSPSEGVGESPRAPVSQVSERPREAKAPSPRVPALPMEPMAVGPYVLRETASFKTSFDKKAKIEVQPVSSGGEPALELNYDLSQGDWVQCYVNVRENFSKYSRVQFHVQGQGASNTLEFKMVDSDGTNAGISWSRQTGKRARTLVDLPLSDLTYMWGGDRTLDLRRVRQIFFAISKKTGDKGGRGRVTLRGIKFS